MLDSKALETKFIDFIISAYKNSIGRYQDVIIVTPALKHYDNAKLISYILEFQPQLLAAVISSNVSNPETTTSYLKMIEPEVYDLIIIDQPSEIPDFEEELLLKIEANIVILSSEEQISESLKNLCTKPNKFFKMCLSMPV